jgi:hypothetical protein
MAKMGRPPAITDELAEEIMSRICAGESIASIFRDDHMPSEKTFYNFCVRDEDFLQRSLRARGFGSHALADQIIEIADNSELEPHDKRIRIDARMRLMGSWNRVYSPKHDHSISGPGGEGPVETKHEVTFVNATQDKQSDE